MKELVEVNQHRPLLELSGCTIPFRKCTMNKLLPYYIKEGRPWVWRLSKLMYTVYQCEGSVLYFEFLGSKKCVWQHFGNHIFT